MSIARFVPQANRALRYFNIYLNTKRPPRNWSLNLFRLLRASPAPLPASSREQTSALLVPISPSRSTSTPARPSRSSPASSPGRSRSLLTSRSQSVPLAPLPPSTNPRGELIFSSKVSHGFREGYEKYRNEWERRRKSSTAEMAWTPYLWSFVSAPQKLVTKQNPLFPTNSAASKSQKLTEKPSGSAEADVSASRGRDAKSRALSRSGSSSSNSSTFSLSPPSSRRSSPLRQPLSVDSTLSTTRSSPTSSRPPTPELIREDDDYFEVEGGTDSLASRRFTSASESSLASGLELRLGVSAPASPETGFSSEKREFDVGKKLEGGKPDGVNYDSSGLNEKPN